MKLLFLIFYLRGADMDEERSEEYRKLRNMEIFGWWLKGALAMLRRLKEEFEDDLLKGKEKIYNSAILDMIADTKNTENFLLHNYDRIQFRNYIKDKKGRPISCEAYLAKEQNYYKEVQQGDGI